MRRLSAQDAQAMADIHAQSFDRAWPALDMAVHTQRDLCFGIERNAELAAFIMLSCAAGQSEILTIATAKTARRQGLAQQLLQDAMRQLQSQNVTEIFLEVAEDNPAAMALYKNTGFQPIGRRPGYYRRASGRVAAITFSKKL